MTQKRNRPRVAHTFDPEALRFLNKYAKERGVGRSTALSELLLHFARQDKVNPTIVRSALKTLRDE